MEDIIEMMWNGDIGLGFWEGVTTTCGYTKVFYLYKNGIWQEIPAKTKKEAIQYFNTEVHKMN